MCFYSLLHLLQVTLKWHGFILPPFSLCSLLLAWCKCWRTCSSNTLTRSPSSRVSWSATGRCKSQTVSCVQIVVSLEKITYNPRKRNDMFKKKKCLPNRIYEWVAVVFIWVNIRFYWRFQNLVDSLWWSLCMPVCKFIKKLLRLSWALTLGKNPITFTANVFFQSQSVCWLRVLIATTAGLSWISLACI